MAIRSGLCARVLLSVETSDTAISHKSGNVPALATPRVLALMEETAVKAIAEAIDSGQTTVGLAVDLTHSVATPVGGRVEAVALVTGTEGNRIYFTIKVVDVVTGSEVARAEHTRVVVDYDRFVRRLGGPDDNLR